MDYDIIIENSPFNQFFSDKIKKIKQKENEFDKNFTDKLINDDIDGMIDFFESGDIKDLNSSLEAEFGFKFWEYIITLNYLTHLQEKSNPFGVINIEKSYIINYLFNKTNLSKEKITCIIDYFTVFKDDIEDFSPNIVNSRKNRLTIKPFVQRDDKVIFGFQHISLCVDLFGNYLFYGRLPYDKKYVSKEFGDKLFDREYSFSNKFNQTLYDEIKIKNPYVEMKICDKKNDKCFHKVKEKCPGEIDLLSLNIKKKEIIIWEAKVVPERYGSRDILNKINNEFIKKDKGYFDKLEKKRQFGGKYINELLEYFSIKGVKDEEWDVKSYLVLEDDTLLKYILKDKYPIISYDDFKHIINQ